MSTVRGPGRPPIDPRELEPLLDAALRMSARKSSRQVTLREIAAEAGVSVGRLQHHFGTRDHLMGRAFERYLLRVTEQLDELRRSPGTAIERMELVIEEVAIHHSWARSHVWIDLLGRSSDSEEYRTIAVGVNDEWFRVIVQLVDEGVRSGEFTLRGTVDDTAWAIIAASDGLTVTTAADGEELADERGERRRRLLRLAVSSLLQYPVPPDPS